MLHMLQVSTGDAAVKMDSAKVFVKGSGETREDESDFFQHKRKSS